MRLGKSTRSLQRSHQVKRKVAIVGLSPSTRHQAPFFDGGFEIWGLNENHYTYFPRFDRWFDLHDRKLMEQPWRNQDHLQWLKKCNAPVYMQSRHDDIPGSLEYPKDEMIEEFGSYFTSTIPYMLALAIREGFSQIHLFGVDAMTQSGYEDQRASIEYFIGIARGRGIHVCIPDDSNLLKAKRMYGYSDDSLEEALEVRIDQLGARRRKLDEDLRTVEENIEECQTSEDEVGHAAVREWEKSREKLFAERNYVSGSLQECRVWWYRLKGCP